MSSQTRWEFCFYTLALALGLSALAMGAVHLATSIAYGALVCLAGLLAISPEPDASLRRDWRKHLGLAVGLFLTLYCLIQATPLPPSWVAALAPRNADVWTRARRLFEASSSLTELSLAPSRTLVEALKVSSYTVVFIASLALATRFGVHRIMRMVFGLALAVAIVTAAHQVVGAERVYGLYEPIDAYSIAPLLNSNNRAGYLNLGFFCGLGVLFRAGTRPHAALIGLGLALLGAEILLCGSVGGTSCLVLGMLVVLVLPRGRARSRGIELSRPIQAGILLSLGAGATMLALTVRHSALGLDDRSLEKLELFTRAARMTWEHPWLGVGRGAFGSVFPAYQGLGAHAVSEHAENFPLQWASEWGIPVAVITVAALGLLVASLLRWRTLGDPLRRCAFVGSIVLILQNLADLGLEVPAVGALLCCVLGASAAGRTRVEAATTDPQSYGWRSWIHTATCALCLVLVVAFGVESPGRLRHELHARLTREASSPTPAFWAALRSAIEEFPGEPYFPLLGASAALAARQNALPWIAHALERSPGSAPAHMELARILQAHGRTSQALGALRQAIELNPAQARRVLALAEQWSLSDAEIAEAAPRGKEGAELLLLLANRTKDGPTRIRLLERALEHDPARLEAHHRLGEQLWHELANPSAGSACAARREECLARAEQEVERGRMPGRSRSDVLRAKLLVERGQKTQAEDYLARACEHHPGDVDCVEELVTLAFENESSRLPDAVRALVASACRNPEGCGEVHLKLGHRFSRASEWATAMAHYRQAAEETPTPVTLLALARAAEHLGQQGLARDAQRRAELLGASASARSTEDAPSVAPPPPPEADYPKKGAHSAAP